MITKIENELFNIEVDALIYKYETLKKELEAEIIQNVIEGKNTVSTEMHFKELNRQIAELKDIKLEGNCRYNEQFIGNDLTSIKNYIKSKKKAI